MDEHIWAATFQKPAPPVCPEKRTSTCQQHYRTDHRDLGFGHPSIRWTLSLLQSCYGWPSMTSNVIRSNCSYSVCAMSKTPKHLLVGKLSPLPIPQKPLSHHKWLPTAMDCRASLPLCFVTMASLKKICQTQFTSHVCKAFFKLFTF